MSYRLHYILGKSDNVWVGQVVEPAMKIVKSFLSEDESLLPSSGTSNSTGKKLIQRDLWTQYICKVLEKKIVNFAHSHPLNLTQLDSELLVIPKFCV